MSEEDDKRHGQCWLLYWQDRVHHASIDFFQKRTSKKDRGVRKQVSNGFSLHDLLVLAIIGQKALQSLIRRQIFLIIGRLLGKQTFGDTLWKQRRDYGRCFAGLPHNNILTPFHHMVIYKKHDGSEKKDQTHRQCGVNRIIYQRK
jgi:hypothetical protein